MLYQDRLTGMLHEVPEGQVQGWGFAETPEGVGEGQMVYDGLGNPLGWGFLKKLVKTAMPLASAIPGPWGLVASRALPMINRAMASRRPPPPPPPMQDMSPPPQMEFDPTAAMGEVPAVYQRPGTYRPPVPPRWIPATRAHWSAGRPASIQPPVAMGPPPIPAGWKRPAVPYTGVQPRRVYMRCAVWRGPGGLVPINPGQPPVAPPPAAAPMGPSRYRSRRRRR
jgi:hypothetical protein